MYNKRFFSYESEGGHISYFDDMSRFSDTTLVSANSTNYICGYYSGHKDVPLELSEDEFLDITLKPSLLESMLSKVKSLQENLIEAVEGKNTWRMSKAADNAEIKGDLSYLDDIRRKRVWVRDEGDRIEKELIALSYKELLEYDVAIDSEQAPAIRSRRITIGAFMERFLPEENDKIQALIETNSVAALRISAFYRRTHVDLDDATLGPFLRLLNSLGVLNPPTKDIYKDRIEELTRDGGDNEVYRIFIGL